MCDYSLQSVASRPAVVGEKLTVRPFGTGTSGFCSPDNPDVAVCLLPGTEISLDFTSATQSNYTQYKTAIFRQTDKELAATHHDALEFPDGKIEKLSFMTAGTSAIVLQLPAAPKTKKEAEEQTRLEVVG